MPRLCKFGGVRVHPAVWVLRVAWLVLPITAGDVIARSLVARSTAVVTVAGISVWLIWAVVLAASLVPLPVTLTLVRVLAPIAPVATAVAAFVTPTSTVDQSVASVASTTLGLVAAIVAVAAASSAPTADEFVDGASYGDERRFALRAPGAFLLGPIPVFWALSVGALLLGAGLLAARSWILGSVAVVLGAITTRRSAAAFHGLSRRWLVFVPAGVTLVDHLSLADPVLLPRRQIAQIGPAPAGSSAPDLTQSALGLALEIDLDSPIEITRRLAATDSEIQLTAALLVTPGRPGAVLREAARRGLRTPSAGSTSQT